MESVGYVLVAALLVPPLLWAAARRLRTLWQRRGATVPVTGRVVGREDLDISEDEFGWLEVAYPFAQQMRTARVIVHRDQHQAHELALLVNPRTGRAVPAQHPYSLTMTAVMTLASPPALAVLVALSLRAGEEMFGRAGILQSVAAPVIAVGSLVVMALVGCIPVVLLALVFGRRRG